jgi:outer membrane protein
MRFKHLFLIAFVLIQQNALAQQKWSLKQCVEHAIENNIGLKQSYINTEVARTNSNQNFASMFPNLNASASQSFNYGRSIDPTTNVFINSNINGASGSLSADVTIFNGFRLQNLLRQSNIDYSASRYDVDKMKNDVAMNTVANFLTVLFGKESLKAANDRVAVTTKQVNNVKLQVEAGSLAQGNLLDIEAQLATEEQAVVAAENTLRQAFLDLTQVMNLESIDGFDIETPQVDIPSLETLTIPAAAINQVALGVMPEIKSADMRYQSAIKGVSIARGSYLPRLSAFGQLSTNYSSISRELDGAPQFIGYAPNGNVTSGGETVLEPNYLVNFRDISFNSQLKNNFNKAFGISLSIPIFNGLSTKYGVERARLQEQNTKLSVDLQKQVLFKSIQQAQIDALNAKKRFEAATKSVNALQTSFSYTEKRFNVGMINSLDYNTIKNNLARAESELLQAKYELIFRIKVLDFYNGKSLI